MSEFLEATMLVCFGCSWPINLVKNIKSKTAKSMSLQFILLIIFGYLAGIAAKLISHKINYVLIVYLLNLVIVSINLAVYFINKRYDRKNNKAALSSDNTPANITANKRDRTEIENKYIEMNKLSKSGGIVFFGSNYFSSLPLVELAQSFNVNENIYNRSVKKTKINELYNMVDVCVSDLKPGKVFVNLGDFDICSNIDIDRFISNYEKIIKRINDETKANIYLLSILSDQPAAKEINNRLKSSAAKYGCRYIDITGALDSDNQTLYVFDLIKTFIRTHPITFDEAMNSVAV